MPIVPVVGENGAPASDLPKQPTREEFQTMLAKPEAILMVPKKGAKPSKYVSKGRVLKRIEMTPHSDGVRFAATFTLEYGEELTVENTPGSSYLTAADVFSFDSSTNKATNAVGTTNMLVPPEPRARAEGGDENSTRLRKRGFDDAALEASNKKIASLEEVVAELTAQIAIDRKETAETKATVEELGEHVAAQGLRVNKLMKKLLKVNQTTLRLEQKLDQV